MRFIIYSFTASGAELGKRLLSFFEERHIRAIHKTSKEYKISNEVRVDFYEADGLIFISSTGIAVRMIAPLLVHKFEDPAVLVINDMGTFTVSLLSGHVGGANEWTMKISKYLGNTPVVTTASDVRGIEALDVFAKKHDLFIDSAEREKEIMTMLLNGARIGWYSEMDLAIHAPVIVSKDLNCREMEGWVFISSTEMDTAVPSVRLIPRNLCVGIGCRKDTPYSTVLDAVKKAFSKKRLDMRGIAMIGTIDLKKEEPALQRLASEYEVPLIIFSTSEINALDGEYERSEFVKQTAGVYAVSEPCAMLMGREMLVKKYRENGVTVSVSRR